MGFSAAPSGAGILCRVLELTIAAHMAAFSTHCSALAGRAAGPGKASRRAVSVRAAAGNGARVDKYSKSDVMCVWRPCSRPGCSALSSGLQHRVWLFSLKSVEGGRVSAVCPRPSSQPTLPSLASRCAAAPSREHALAASPRL